MIDICISIGSNIPDRTGHLEHAVDLMRDRLGDMVKKSSFYETSSWGFDSGPFLNGVIMIRTALSPVACMERMLEIEHEMGRERKDNGYADRVIDLDLLSYGQRRFVTDGLTIPHPRFAERRFVLEPWSEICPQLMIGGGDITVAMYKEACADNGRCVKLEYV